MIGYEHPINPPNLAQKSVNGSNRDNDIPKILVCDDDAMVRILARECLEDAGMQVVEAEDGDAAVDLFFSEKPDLVFLDVEMPGKTGFEVCQAIRDSEIGASVPVLIATGSDDKESIDHGFNAGATQYKTKPINWSLLSRDIRYMLRASKAFIDLKAQEGRLRYLAYFDHLTDLPNRRSFNEQLRRNMIEAAKQGGNHGLMIIDIDHFKRINDSLGHERGDQLLRNIAIRLHDSMAKIAHIASDYAGKITEIKQNQLSLELARPGGDEFSILATNVNNIEELTTIGAAVLEALVEPISLGTQNLVVTPSIGIAMSPDHGTDPEVLLRNADAAMHAAKADGRARIRVYDESLNRDAAERILLEAELREALRVGDQITMAYQPQIDTATGRISGVEALVRWNNPSMGMISPAKFIPIAESSGLIIALGDTIMQCVSNDALSAGDQLPDNIVISINLSPLQFSQSDFVEHLYNTLATLDAKFKIELELTEGVIMSDAVSNKAKLEQLKELGFDLAIDDFGTGYSALSYLRNFPIDTLKIDRSFIMDLGSPDGDGIVKAILGLCHALKLRIVAEGVETAEQAQFLCANGCTAIQGFYLEKPLPVDGLLSVIDRDYSAMLPGSPSSKAT